MKKETKRLGLLGTTSFCSAVLTGVLATALTGGVAHAQDTAPKTTASEPSKDIQEVVVTGTRIKRPQFDGTVPGIQVTKEEIVQRGFTNAYDVVLSQPMVSSGASPYGNNGGQTSSLGMAFADLLALGPQRTLTLVNGRRVVSSNAATLFVSGNYAGSQVDLSGIPTQMIDRVDTLTVGGAAAYGSDAIAGVINYIIKDKYVGTEARVSYRASEKGDAGRYSFNVLHGRNFADGKGNIAIAYEYNKTDALYADARPWIIDTAVGVTNFANGSKRNPNFAANAIIDVTGQNNGAFLRSADDGLPSTIYAYNSRSSTVWPSGIVFSPNTTVGTNTTAGLTCPGSTVATGTGAFGTSTCVWGTTPLSFSAATQLVPGIPTGNGLYGTFASGTFPNFAPTSLAPGVTAAAVFTRYGITPPSGLTTAQLNTLAINVLQSKLPTLREYLAANPNTDINMIIGTLNPSMPRIANTDPATSNLFPFIAKPVRFNANGEAENYSFTNLSPTQAGVFGAAQNGFDSSYYNLLQNEQTRNIVSLFATYKINDDLTFYTQNILSRTETVLPRNSASANSVTSTAQESSSLIMNISNPYLSDASKAVLTASGAVATNGSFVFGRTNQDILGDNPLFGKTNTSNFTQGLKGNFELAGHPWKFDASYTYGKSDGDVKFKGIKDLEYQLALDVVKVGNDVVCRAKTTPSSYLGKTLSGTAKNLVDVIQPDGRVAKIAFQPKVTQDMIDQCQPLNPFGYGKMSDAAKAYVTADQTYAFENVQTFLQGSATTDIFQAPGGPVGFALAAEHRTTENKYRVDEISQFGRTRSASIARTDYETEATELGLELNIPVFGGDFTLPFVRSLEINPSVRWSRQKGSAPEYYRQSSVEGRVGALTTPSYQGDTAQIFSLAGTFSPVKDISFRGNMTRSIRQPDGVELFLGGQPAFTTPTDPCTLTNINSSSNPTTRKANCVADLIKYGYATNETEANGFLNTYAPASLSLLGARFGNSGLRPETAKSWTAGFILAPRWVKNLRISADYVDIQVQDMLTRVSLTDLANFCYDSPSYPDNSAAYGTNTCGSFVRYNKLSDPAPNTSLDFTIKDGWQSTYLNLAKQNVRSVNIVVQYRFDIADTFGLKGNWGRLSLNSNAYRTLEYSYTPSGQAADLQDYVGGWDYPEWQTNSTIGYSRDKFSTSLNINTVSSTVYKNGGVDYTIEAFPYLNRDAYAIYNLFLGYDITDKAEVRLNVNNVANTRFVDERVGSIYSSIGRTFQVSLFAKF
ncbi:TonB-dependent receptor [Asticcacaulis sp. DW145]|uniref:TonB-dependent receptor domain-containing protein n=1 Tax=Asticcacaulis sp. DW145 TaxID=3095608 RepID=UPI0030928533|nr:TonB-dependent receptor [Asticcacaulis sp. DW145]